MKVTVLSSSLAVNGLGRVWMLATLLGRHYEVEVVGRLAAGASIFPWFADYPYRVIPSDGLPATMRAMERAITGDVVVACGIGMTSFGVGLLAKLRRRMPLVLDMLDWEVFDHYKWKTPASRAFMIARNLVGPEWSNGHSFKYRWVLDHLTGVADERTVACEFLKQRYGGVILPHGADTARFDPAKFERRAARRKWGLPEDAVILMFGGHPSRLKGLELTLSALRGLEGRVDARLVLVGYDERHPYTKSLMDLAPPDRIIALGSQPFALMPELLATADVVALPQTREPKSVGYVPSKLYEAMAMEIPVVASAVGDLPAILEGCGYIVPTDDAAALRLAIEHIATHPEEAREMGRRARLKVLEKHSWEVMDRTLHRVIESVATKLRRGATAPVRSDAGTIA